SLDRGPLCRQDPRGREQSSQRRGRAFPDDDPDRLTPARGHEPPRQASSAGTIRHPDIVFGPFRAKLLASYDRRARVDRSDGLPMSAGSKAETIATQFMLGLFPICALVLFGAVALTGIDLRALTWAAMLLDIIAGIILIGTVFAAIHHAEAIAHVIGEPF